MNNKKKKKICMDRTIPQLVKEEKTTNRVLPLGASLHSEVRT